MGETGETYLVGPDKLMRSDSYIDPEFHTVDTSFQNPTKGVVDTVAAREALSGQSGQGVIEDYRNMNALTFYEPLNIFDTHWAFITEIDEAEAFSAVHDLRLADRNRCGLCTLRYFVRGMVLITRSIAAPINRIIAKLRDGSEQVNSASTQWLRRASLWPTALRIKPPPLRRPLPHLKRCLQ